MKYESLAELIEPYVDVFHFDDLPKEVGDRVFYDAPEMAFGWRLLYGPDDRRYGARETDIFENPANKDADRYWLLVELETWWVKLKIERLQPNETSDSLNSELDVLQAELTTRKQNPKSPVWNSYPGLRGAV